MALQSLASFYDNPLVPAEIHSRIVGSLNASSRASSSVFASSAAIRGLQWSC